MKKVIIVSDPEDVLLVRTLSEVPRDLENFEVYRPVRPRGFPTLGRAPDLIPMGVEQIADGVFVGKFDDRMVAIVDAKGMVMSHHFREIGVREDGTIRAVDNHGLEVTLSPTAYSTSEV